jgi:hypothetical protein
MKERINNIQKVTKSLIYIKNQQKLDCNRLVDLNELQTSSSLNKF